MNRLKHICQIKNCVRIYPGDVSLWLKQKVEGNNDIIINQDEEFITSWMPKTQAVIRSALGWYISVYKPNYATYTVNQVTGEKSLLLDDGMLEKVIGQYGLVVYKFGEGAVSRLVDMRTLETVFDFQTRLRYQMFDQVHQIVILLIDVDRLYCYGLARQRMRFVLSLADLGYPQWVEDAGGFNTRTDVGSDQWLEDYQSSLRPNIFFQLIGVHGHLLWAHVSKYRLLAIDVRTGQVEYERPSFLEPRMHMYFFTNQSNRTSIDWLMDHQAGKMYLACRLFVLEFDLVTRQLRLLKDYSVLPEPEQYSFTYTTLHEGNILFVGTHTNPSDSYVLGCFSPQTCEVVWEYDNEPSGLFFIDTPIVHQGRIYVRDSDYNVQVFELGE